MDDDFNTALAISNLYGYFKKIKALAKEKDQLAGAMASQIIKTYSLLGLFTMKPEEFLSSVKKEEQTVPEEVVKLAEERILARQNKDWAKADEIRAKLTQLGYAVKDTKDGYNLEKI